MAKRNPWENVELPSDWDPEKNRFLNPLLGRNGRVQLPESKTLDALINLEAPESQEERKQHDWIRIYGDKFANMADYYKILKGIAFYIANVSEVFTNVASVLRTGLEDRGVVTRTGIVYEGDKEADIIHNFPRDTLSGAEGREKVVAPVYGGKKLPEVLADEEGLHYVQTLFGTTDNAEEIIAVIGRMFNLKAGKVGLWTPDVSVRNNSYACGFVYKPGTGLFIKADWPLDKPGHGYPLEKVTVKISGKIVSFE